MRKENAGTAVRSVWPLITGDTKPSRGMPEMRLVVSIIRMLTVVVEEGILRSGGG